MNTEEIKHLRDLVLADMLNCNDKAINGSILRKLDKQLTIHGVVSSLPSECVENWESNYYCSLSGKCQKCEK